MFKQIAQFIRAYLKGDEAELNINRTFVFAWWEVALIVFIIIWAIYLIWR